MVFIKDSGLVLLTSKTIPNEFVSHNLLHQPEKQIPCWLRDGDAIRAVRGVDGITGGCPVGRGQIAVLLQDKARGRRRPRNDNAAAIGKRNT